MPGAEGRWARGGLHNTASPGNDDALYAQNLKKGDLMVCFYDNKTIKDMEIFLYEVNMQEFEELEVCEFLVFCTQR